MVEDLSLQVNCKSTHGNTKNMHIFGFGLYTNQCVIILIN